MLDKEIGEDLSQLPLKDILEHEDLELEELLCIKDIHTKIKLNMKTFVEHCRKKTQFTDRLINLGLKCPMHESNNQKMKNITYIATDILTCDHETLADLFILPTKKGENVEEELLNDDQIEEEIETEEPPTDQASEEEKYVFLIKIVEYFQNDQLDQNCLNYIAKALFTLVRKKISEFLQFFLANPQYFNRLVAISHFPAITHLLAKMLTDDDDNLTAKGLQLKKKIIPSMLLKLHEQIQKKQSQQLLQGIQDIINASRYGDNEQRSELQKMSDQLVSPEEVGFFIKTQLNSLETTQKTQGRFHALLNSSTYLTHVLNRLNMDQQQDFMFNTPQEFKPTLNYKIDQIFFSFCKIISCLDQVWHFKEIADKPFGFVPVKIAQPLLIMTKHSRFGSFYEKISKEERSLALQSLLKMACLTNISGVFLQSLTTLLQKMLTEEELMAEKDQQIIKPSDLYLSIEKYSAAICVCIALVLEQTKIQRNKDQNGIYFRKILLLVDNYFKHPAVLKKYPKTETLEHLFPSFNNRNCKLYAEKAVVLDHPGGSKAQQVQQFKFIYKNHNLIKSYQSYCPDLQQDYLQKKQKQQFPEFQLQQKQQKSKQIFFKLQGRLKALKNRVMQKITDKESINTEEMLITTPPKLEENNLSFTQNSKENNNSEEKQNNQEKSNEEKNQQFKLSPQKNQEMRALNFFVRHLVIY